MTSEMTDADKALTAFLSQMLRDGVPPAHLIAALTDNLEVMRYLFDEQEGGA